MNAEQFNEHYHGKQVPVSFIDFTGKHVSTKVRSQAWFSNKHKTDVVHVDGQLPCVPINDLTIVSEK